MPLNPQEYQGSEESRMRDILSQHIYSPSLLPGPMPPQAFPVALAALGGAPLPAAPAVLPLPSTT